jgi:DnaJ-class molecular chaperone
MAALVVVLCLACFLLGIVTHIAARYLLKRLNTTCRRCDGDGYYDHTPSQFRACALCEGRGYYNRLEPAPGADAAFADVMDAGAEDE